MRILVVEDDTILRQGLVDLFATEGYEVQQAKNGEEALDFGKSEPFDLVVLDLMLPRMDGLTVCKKLRKIKPGLSILMLTARNLEEDKITGLDEGADDYMTKPFSMHELLARVRVIERRTHMIPAEPDCIMCGSYGHREAAQEGGSQSAATRTDFGHKKYGISVGKPYCWR